MIGEVASGDQATAAQYNTVLAGPLGEIAQLGADVTLTTANTWYDGPSLSLTAATWLLIASVELSALGTIKIWDGTTAYGSGETIDEGTVVALGRVTLGSTTTIKVSASCWVGGTVMKAATPANSAGNNATSLVAIAVR